MEKLPDFLKWYSLQKQMKGDDDRKMSEDEGEDEKKRVEIPAAPWDHPGPFVWWRLHHKYDVMRQWKEEQVRKQREQWVREVKEKMEKFQQFEKFQAAMEEHRQKAENMKKLQGVLRLHAQVHKEQEFAEMMRTFTQKKKQYVFTVVYELMKFCKCSESIMDLQRFFNPDSVRNMNEVHSNNTDVMNIDEHLAFPHPRTQEEAKKMFMKGLVKTLCVSAKEYVHHVRMFAAHHLAHHFAMETMGDMQTAGNTGDMQPMGDIMSDDKSGNYGF
ncbi:uncharacterized protein LOC124253306 [Haliotis rubra]|uniref:uncharacterized protein LOC124253306 n=1 Tax=Haliotis rubra TaxID=36100 RepID=UPI001EE5E956|nr:uncharacterized protein LOC124253306 [Haliotis rubra]